MRLVYVNQRGEVGTVDEPRLDATTERHLVAVPPPPAAPGSPIDALERDRDLGLMVECTTGCPNDRQLTWLKRGLALRHRTWITWPEEGVVECITTERLASFRRHWLVITFYEY